MPAIAEVQFKAVNSQQVVGAFKSVGDSASTATTKVQQNSNAMKTMGQGMKSSMGGIAQVTTAFATLSLSIVSTWRAYRDLGDAQIAVDKANLRVKKTTEAIRKSEAEVAKLRKESAKGGLENVAATHKIQLMEQKLAKDRKEGKKSALELRVQEDAILVARKEGVPSSKKLTDAENKLQLQKEQLGVQTDVANEAQERFNDTQQDFYLSIIPSVLSGVALLTSAFKGIGSTLRGGGGLIGGLGPIGLILGGITLAIIAFKTNFLGLRDAVGGVIDWIKERFGLWKDTIEKVFNLIKSGNWSGAFALIQEAAAKFWEDLKKSVPFFGEVESLVNKIKNGNWKGALLQIWKAAVDVWNTIKTSVPFLGDIEKFILSISQAKWSDAFDAIKKAITDSGIQAAIDSILGKGWTTKAIEGLTALGPMIGNLAAQAKIAAEKGDWKGVGTAINQGITEGLKATGGQAIIDNMLKFGIGPAAILQAWKDPRQRKQWYEIGLATVNGIGEGLKTVGSFLDPYIADFIKAIFTPATWTNAMNATKDTILSIGTSIMGAIGTASTSAAASPDFWADTGKAIWDGIVGWMTDNMPDTTLVIQQLVSEFTFAVNEAAIDFQNMGIDMWNQIVKGIKAGMVEFTKNPVLSIITPFFNKMKEAVNSPEFAKAGELKIIPKVDISPGLASARKMTETINKMAPKINVTTPTNTKLAEQARNKINQMKATIKVTTQLMGNQAARSAVMKANRIPGMQHGYSGTVKRPTMFIAGEGGRPEDVTVRPRGSVQRGGSGGGVGFSGTINVYVDGVLRPARYDMGARK